MAYRRFVNLTHFSAKVEMSVAVLPTIGTQHDQFLPPSNIGRALAIFFAKRIQILVHKY